MQAWVSLDFHSPEWWDKCVYGMHNHHLPHWTTGWKTIETRSSFSNSATQRDQAEHLSSLPKSNRETCEIFMPQILEMLSAMHISASEQSWVTLKAQDRCTSRPWWRLSIQILLTLQGKLGDKSKHHCYRWNGGGPWECSPHGAFAKIRWEHMCEAWYLPDTQWSIQVR